jgi:hypothetical protein
MKRLTLELTDRDIELLREAVETLGKSDSEAIHVQLIVANAILDAETLEDSEN